MDGDNGYGYIQDDSTYDDLINNSVWNGTGDQFLYGQSQPQQQQQQTHQPQDLYGSFANNQQHQLQQPSFGNANISLQQQSYTSASYNPQYVSRYQPNPQTSAFFGATATSVDPLLQTSSPSPYHSTQESPFAQSSTTVSPQYLEYGMANAHQPASRNVPQQLYQQQQQRSQPQSKSISNTYDQRTHDPSTLYFNSLDSGNLQHNTSNQIHYPALPSERQNNEFRPTINPGNVGHNSQIQQLQRQTNSVSPLNAPLQQQAKQIRPPQQNPLRVVEPDQLKNAQGDASRQPLAHAPFLTFDTTPVNINITLKNTVPKYHPRKSRSGKELVPGFDSSQSLVPGRVSVKRERVPKVAKPPATKWKGSSHGPKILVGKPSSLREDGSAVATKVPSTPTETSTSEEESSSEEESEYEDEIMLKDVSEIRGPARPSSIPSGARWDVIGIIWKDPNSNPSSDVVKAAMEEYGNYIIGLRTKIKSNKEAIAAQPKNPALAADRTQLLEALYEAVAAANELGYDGIVENLGGHLRFVNGLTTTLIDCIKAEDFLGKLPRAVFTLLAKFQTMTDEALKRLKFEGITKRWIKKGDPQINTDIATILANTIDAKERAKKLEKDAAKLAAQKSTLEKITQAKLRTGDTNKAPVINPAKRPHEGDAANGKPNKKFASDAAGTPAAKPAPAKRANLLGIATKPISKVAPLKKREPSPPAASRLGALLASIAEPAKPQKTVEAPTRAPETPEEKAKRERKESRRHLRVKFREGPELEEIREFTHEAAEDEGRQGDMLKDAHDERSEGMMHKRRVAEDIDDDDDAQPSDFEDRVYRDLIEIDFSHMPTKTSFGEKYITRGGSLTFKTPEQEAQELREAHEIMAIYTDDDDIPPTPKEPPPLALAQVDGAAEVKPAVTLKEPTEAWLLQRLSELQQFGPEYATQVFVRRMEEQKSAALRARGIAQTFSAPLPPSAEVTKAQPPTMDVAAYQELVRIVSLLKGKPYPATEPPEWMTNHSQRTVWWDGYNRDNAMKPQVAPVAAEQPYLPPPQQPPQMQAQAPMQQPPPQVQPLYQSAPVAVPIDVPVAASTADIGAQIQQLMAGYNGGNAAPTLQPYDQAAYLAAYYQAQQQAHVPPPPPPPGPPPQRWEGSGWDDQPPETKNHKSKSRGYEMKEWGGNNKNDSPFDENGEYKGKKKPCRFYREGKCAKGAKCTYLHD